MKSRTTLITDLVSSPPDDGPNLIVTESTLSGSLVLTIDDNFPLPYTYTIDIDYSALMLDGSQFSRPTDTLMTDNPIAILTGELISGITGEPDYMSYGNATLTPAPFVCVECGYQMSLNFRANPFFGNPIVLSYDENNPYDSGQVNFRLFIAEVPLPPTIWLFASSLILLGYKKMPRSRI